jgi:CAAX prenyl protease-like protein
MAKSRQHKATQTPSTVFRRKITAFVAPMGVFIALLGLTSLLPAVGRGFWVQHPEYWIFPLQTIVCGGLVWRFWPDYQLRAPRQVGIGIVVGLLVFVLWISPQSFLGFPARIIGFDPDVFASQPALYWVTVLLRFVRLVVVVPLVEEIFWRGFLLRYLIDEKFDQVPFGTFRWLSFCVVTAAFALSHSTPDWPAAALTGALYNWAAYRTKSLTTCVITHGLTNALLGVWIMSTKQWGFW